MACEYRGAWGCRDSGAPGCPRSGCPRSPWRGISDSVGTLGRPPDPAESAPSPMNDDHARPIPQGNRPEPPADDDVYVVDTRRGSRRRGDGGDRAAAPAQPSPATAPPIGHPGAFDELGRPVGAGGTAPPAAPTGPRAPSAPREPRMPRPGRTKRVMTVVVVALLAWAAFIVVTPVHAWSQVTREDTTPTGTRPADAAGHTYLLVGSDSREGLTAAQRKALGVGGDASGRRTDSIILVHTPSGSGKPVLISIPRDSYLT